MRGDRDADGGTRGDEPAGEGLEVAVAVGLDLEHRRRPAVLARLDELVVPVGALDEPDLQRRRARSSARRPVEDRRRAARASRADRPGARARPTARRGTRPRRAARARGRAPPRGSRATPCRCGRGRRARGPARSSGRRRRPASSRPSDGASGRSSGVSAETLTETFARASGPVQSRSSIGRAGQRGRLAGDLLERVGAAPGVAVGLGLGDRRLSEQVDGARHAALPQPAEHPERGRRGLADDEPVGHVLDAAGGGGAERGPARLRVRDPHRRRDRRRGVRNLLEEAGQMAREVVERAARRDDVDEPEQRRAQLAVARGELHRPRVERPHRMARGGRERGGQLGADPLDLGSSASPVAAHGAAAPFGTAMLAGGVARSIASQLMSRARTLLVGPAAAAQAEQPLGVQQVDRRRRR